MYAARYNLTETNLQLKRNIVAIEIKIILFIIIYVFNEYLVATNINQSILESPRNIPVKKIMRIF